MKIRARDNGYEVLEVKRDLDIIVKYMNVIVSFILDSNDSDKNILIVVIVVCVIIVVFVVFIVFICMLRRKNEDKMKDDGFSFLVLGFLIFVLYDRFLVYSY